MKQKILKIGTLESGFRTKVDSWGGEDGHEVKPGEIWRTPGLRCPNYETPLHAIGDGWRLMCPPVYTKNYFNEIEGYIWWFEKYD